MGAAPETLEEHRLTPEQLHEIEREWFLDTTTGELKPEENPADDPRARPEPVRVARRTYD